MKTKAIAFLAGLVFSTGTATAAEMSEVMWGIHHPGGDYKSFTIPLTDPNVCKNQCAVETRCVAWAYQANINTCWLKDQAPETSLTVDPNLSSGVKALSGGTTGGSP